MTHIVENKEKLIWRVRRIRGQVEGIERALESDQECSDVLQVITAARGAINGLMVELLEGHIRNHVLEPKKKGTNIQQAEAAEELIEVIRSYLK